MIGPVSRFAALEWKRRTASVLIGSRSMLSSLAKLKAMLAKRNLDASRASGLPVTLGSISAQASSKALVMTLRVSGPKAAAPLISSASFHDTLPTPQGNDLGSPHT